ncbi:MAG: hypothetical protein QOC99_2025 [Acidobacteriota bacterium]|jgi:hypothetical protein|nr:hypothetical protein [Acidobacteriota bacterium]
MQSKKTTKKPKKASLTIHSKPISRSIRELNKESCKDGDDFFGPHPIRRNPEIAEEREKRLAARKALTLKAFRIAYENNHRRHSS